jgi:hypothetical protein
MTKALLALAALAAAGMTRAEAAPSAIRLDTQMFVETVKTDINGRPRRTLASADRAAPGDRVVMVLRWKNEGPQPIRSFAVSRATLRGAAPDLNAPGLEISVDGGAHWDRFDRIWLPTPLGGVRRAVAEDVTHVRWLLPDPAHPGQAGRFSYRTTLR